MSRAGPLPELRGRLLGGPDPQCKFSRTGPMSEVVLLGTVAVRVPGQVLRWDAAKLTIPDNPDAAKLQRRNYPEGWKVAGL